MFDRQLMELDEQVVGALPCDKRVMSWRHEQDLVFNPRAGVS
jgi:hypothetical protein